MARLDDLLSIKIDFEQSHLFFPRIIISIIILLTLIIGLKKLVARFKDKNSATSIDKFKFFKPGFDKIKLFGLIGLIPLYFFSMDFIGSFFPNQGLGFLFTSIPFIFTMSILFAGKDMYKKHRSAIIISSFVTPLSAWMLFAKIFYITLP